MNPMGDFNIKPAVVTDLENVMHLVHDAKQFMHSIGNFQWDGDYPRDETFAKDIMDRHLFNLVCGRELAGFICINRIQPLEYDAVEWETPQDSLIIHRMVMARPYAGKGLAQKLMLFAEEMAFKNGLQSVRSDTNSRNMPMLHIFQKMGYRFTGNIVLRQKKDLFCCYEKAL